VIALSPQELVEQELNVLPGWSVIIPVKNGNLKDFMGCYVSCFRKNICFHRKTGQIYNFGKDESVAVGVQAGNLLTS